MKEGRKRKHTMKQRIDIHLAREIRETWGGLNEKGKPESFEFIIKNMHEALIKLEKLFDDGKKHTARELNEKLSQEIKE